MILRWRQVVPALLLGCLLGLWAGLAVGRWRHSPPSPDRMLSRLSRELSLDAGQKEALKAVLEGYRGRFDALHQDAEARVGELRASMHTDIAKILRPEQQQRFQELQTRWQARRQRWKKLP